MTELLQQAIAELQKLPIDQQNAIANLILTELKNNKENTLLDRLSSEEAVVWSPQTERAGVQALSDLLSKAKQETSCLILRDFSLRKKAIPLVKLLQCHIYP